MKKFWILSVICIMVGVTGYLYAINPGLTGPNQQKEREESQSSDIFESLDKLTSEEIEEAFETLQEVREYRICSLRGLKGVTLWVMVSAETGLDSSVNEKDLQNEVERKLRQSGIRVYSPQERASDRINIAAFSISVSIGKANQKVTETPLHVVMVSAELHQEVALVRNPKIRTDAVTWKVCFAAQDISEEKLHSLVRDYALTYTSMFIWDYLAANPREESREDKEKR